jgi:type III secretion protein C
MKPWHCFAGALALLATTLFGSAAQAAPPPWPEVSFSYMARSHRLDGVLNSFGRSFGLRVQASASIEESGLLVDGTLTATSPTDFMNQLASTYGLAWFYQGGVLHVSRIEEQVTRVLTMPGSGGAALKKALLEVGLIEPKFGWADIADRSAALVSGPPAYVDVLARALADLPMPPLLSDQQLRVFRLRHASVDDRVIFYRDKQIVTTGVANMLRALVAGDGGKTGTNIALAEMAAPLRGALQPMQPAHALEADTAGGASRDEKSDEREPRAAAEGGTAAAGGTRRATPPKGAAVPTVQADSRLNALIIRARPEQLQVYEQLIQLLDVPSPLIEIEAVIVDVNKTKVTSLGIDWGARVGSIAGGYGTTSSAADATSATLVRGSGMNPASLVADAGNFMTTRINVLEKEGDARIVSRPTVLTIDNLGALIDLSETFYVSVTSERAANIVPVTVGVTLRVTPHIVDLPDGRKAVHLTVDIEDGSLVTPTTGTIPMVRKSTIGTQAVMGENQSLLVAGFNSERDTMQDNGVPGLRKLPFIGSFFGKKDGDVEKRERLFLITPRIIQSAAAGLPVTAPPAAQATVQPAAQPTAQPTVSR